MKYLISVLIVISMSGCQLMTTPHQKKKTVIRKEIEVLELKKRKAILQLQLERIENLEVKELEKGE